MSGVNLKLFRQRLGLTQAKTARQLGVAPNTFARWERSELPIPEWATQLLSRMAENTQSGSVVTRPEGIVLDPHHKAILEGLQGHLDWDVFEACAVELVGKDGWSVVAVPGGSDDGFDGAVADPDGEPFPLIVTTGKGALGNLRRNLKTLRRQGWRAEKAIFATSRRLRGDTRRKLRDAARDFGVTLVQVYDQDWFAYRLYENPAWCKRLLGLTGRPRALSPFPNTKRPLLGDAVLGREQEMQWLIDRQRDCLLIGGPGYGKTFLLRALVNQGRALFLVDDNREQIANDLRELKPPTVIIDDAHVHRELIDTFVQLRTELRAEDVRIIATCWPSEVSSVRTSLTLADEDVYNLELIDADTIIEIIKSIGVKGPDELLAIIRQQSAGRPGLAATLAHLCLAGNIKQVVSGESLLDQLVGGIDSILDVSAKSLLAPFALAGDAGAGQDEVATYLGLPRVDVSRKLAVLAAAGIIRERQHWGPIEGPAPISVEPPQMRWVLVKEAFFGGVGSLDYRPLLELLGNRGDTIETLMGALSRGAPVPNILSILEDTGSTRLWAKYASLGTPETAYVIDHYPELIMSFAQSALEHMPEKAVPRLLDTVKRNEYQSLSRQNSGALNEIQKWAVNVPPTVQTEDLIHRRSLLVRETERWWRGSQSNHLAIHTMCMALMPETEHISLDPGTGSTMNIRTAIFVKPVLEQLTEFWPSVLNVIGEADEVPWNDLFRLVSNWYYGGNKESIPNETRSVLQRFAIQMLEDLAKASRDRPGVQNRIRHEMIRINPNMSIALDAGFEAVYPAIHPYSQDLQARLADDLAERLGCLTSQEMAVFLNRIRAEAAFAEIQGPGPVLPSVCSQLAEAISNPLLAAETFISYKLPGFVVQPFLNRVAREDSPGWRCLAETCMQGGPYQRAAISTILTQPEPPSNLLTEAILRVSEMWTDFRGLFDTEQISTSALERMLYASNPKLAAAAAIHYWVRLREKCLDGQYGSYWRSAILGATFDDSNWLLLGEYRLGQILCNDSELATDWMITALSNDGVRSSLSYFGKERKETIGKAIQSMSLDQRRLVLRALSVEQTWRPLEFAQMLVGEDHGLYEELLAVDSLSDYHLAPLSGNLDAAWLAKAKIALDAGKSINDIVEASFTMGGPLVWSRSESGMWGSKRQAFEALAEMDKSDPRVLGIARRGAEIMSQYEEAAEERERKRAVFGT